MCLFIKQNMDVTASQLIEKCQTEEELDQLLDHLPLDERGNFLALRRRCELFHPQLLDNSLDEQNVFEGNQPVSQLYWYIYKVNVFHAVLLNETVTRQL